MKNILAQNGLCSICPGRNPEILLVPHPEVSQKTTTPLCLSGVSLEGLQGYCCPQRHCWSMLLRQRTSWKTYITMAKVYYKKAHGKDSKKHPENPKSGWIEQLNIAKPFCNWDDSLIHEGPSIFHTMPTMNNPWPRCLTLKRRDWEVRTTPVVSWMIFQRTKIEQNLRSNLGKLV